MEDPARVLFQLHAFFADLLDCTLDGIDGSVEVFLGDLEG
jgi:hypothetical protein